MVNLDWRVESRAGVTLVELTIENPTRVAQRVRVANRLDGPVWPPRREGVPEAGWDDGGFEGVVQSGGQRALGYATPTTPASSGSPTSSASPAESASSASPAESASSASPAESASSASPAEPPVELVWTERAGQTERPENAEPTVEATPEGVVRALGDARPPADAVPTPSGDSVPTPSRNSDANTTTNADTDGNADANTNADANANANADPRSSP